MKGKLQIVLVVACLVPLFGLAKEETMVERRQRIMRKYLRGHANIAQGELEAEVAEPENEKLIGSEYFKTVRSGLQRQKSGTPIPRPPPPQRRRLPTAKERNWLLAADPTTSGLVASSEEEETSKKPVDWTLWGQSREKSLYGETSSKSWYGRKKDPLVGTSGYGFHRQKDSSNSSETRLFSFGKDSSMLQRKETVPAAGYSGVFGRKKEQQPSGFGTLDLTRNPIHDPNLNKSRLKSPFQRESAPSTERSIGFGSKTKNHTPYKSPYGTQKQQQWGGQQQGQQQEYKRVDLRQKKKKRTSSHYDPSQADAYVNEFMPKSKRR